MQKTSPVLPICGQHREVVNLTGFTVHGCELVQLFT